jgi:hypothetical protein
MAYYRFSIHGFELQMDLIEKRIGNKETTNHDELREELRLRYETMSLIAQTEKLSHYVLYVYWYGSTIFSGRVISALV